MEHKINVKHVKRRVFRTVAQSTPNVFGVLSIMPCATAVNDFLGVPCATIGVSHGVMLDQMLR